MSHDHSAFVTVIDPVAKTTWKMDSGGSTLNTLVVSADKKRLFASSTSDHAVFGFDLSTEKLVQGGTLCPPDDYCGSPDAMALTPDGNTLFVADLIAPVFTPLATTNLAPSAPREPIVDGGMPSYAAFEPNSLAAYFGNFSKALISVRSLVVDLQTWTLSVVWDGFELPAPQNGSGKAATCGFDWLPAQELFVAGNCTGDELVVFDVDSRQPLATAPTSAMPFRITADPAQSADKGRIYVPSAQGWNLQVFDVTRDTRGSAAITLVKTLSHPCTSPIEVAFGASPDKAYVLCAHEVLVLDTSSLTITASIPLDASAYDMVVVTK